MMQCVFLMGLMSVIWALWGLTYTAMGAAMLWVGWFGFNAGSELASDDLTSSAFAVTHLSAAAGAVAWAAMEWITRGKPSILGIYI